MMVKSLVLCGAVVALALVGCATAPSPEPMDFRTLRAEAESFAYAYPHSVSKSSSQTQTFDAVSLIGRGSETLARRAWVDGATSEFQEASSADCPAVATMAAEFARLPPPRTRASDLLNPGDPVYIEGPPDQALTGGPSYEVETFARFENATRSRLRYSAGNISPAAEWHERALIALEPCWRPAR